MVAVMTGGTQGLGRGVATALAAAGHQVIIGVRTSGSAPTGCAELARDDAAVRTLWDDSAHLVGLANP